MSFSADWLAMREPADHRARNGEILAILRAHFADHGRMTVVDLGCGAGSNLRALAPVLPAAQEWWLVDHDPALLAAAQRRVAAWADEAEAAQDGIKVRKAGRGLRVRFRQADLSADIESALADAPDLVTAAALFDLVSTAWIERFADAVAHRRAVFSAALTYDGSEIWAPAHPADAAMLEAFHGHQRHDKGFGPSAGPDATAALARAFGMRGYDVTTGPSPWRLDPRDDAPLVGTLATGIAEAVRETGRVPEASVGSWLEARCSGAGCTIGHMDLLAMPRS